MPLHQPYQITGYHSCDRDTGIKVLNGEMDLEPSNNKWDWLGEGVYFWELNPKRAIEYAIECAEGTQFNKKRINTPFVLGATIELGRCLNLIEPESIALLKKGYTELERIIKETGKKMPVNIDNNRRLDCAVILHLQQAAKELGKPYETVRCAFNEGQPIYPGTTIASRNHIQVSVINREMIRGYFLPRPIELYNPYLKKEFK